jgi:hypothetical protein
VSAAPPRLGRRQPARRRLLRFSIGLASIVVAFGAGLALGQSLEDNPGGGKSQTLMRTLKPLELPPVRETVTVTVRP